jgi:hypothetical protein
MVAQQSHMEEYSTLEVAMPSEKVVREELQPILLPCELRERRSLLLSASFMTSLYRTRKQ